VTVASQIVLAAAPAAATLALYVGGETLQAAVNDPSLPTIVAAAKELGLPALVLGFVGWCTIKIGRFLAPLVARFFADHHVFMNTVPVQLRAIEEGLEQHDEAHTRQSTALGEIRDDTRRLIERTQPRSGGGQN
jgi:hypothetical protein